MAYLSVWTSGQRRQALRSNLNCKATQHTSMEHILSPTTIPTTPTGGHALPLTPRPMLPLQLSKGTDASHRLAHIQWLEIAGTDQREGKTFYIIHIFMRNDNTHSHIPTSPANRDQAVDILSKPTRIEPDYRVRRRMSEFVTLRDNLVFTVQGPHKKYCHFCNDLLTVLVYSATRWVMALRPLLVSTKRRTRTLNRFLREVLGEYQSKRPLVHTRGACAAIDDVPCMLHEFLLGVEQDSHL